MNLFIHLLTGHLIGDFALQTGTIARQKRYSYRGLLVHLAIVTAATLGVTFRLPAGIKAALLVSFGHLLIDALRTGPLRDLRRFALAYFVGDQGLHVAVMLLAVKLFQPPSTWSWRILLKPYTMEDVYLLLLSAFIFLVFVVPVIEALLHLELVHDTDPFHLRVTNRMRLLGAAERVVGLLVCLSPWPYLAPLVFVPHFIYRFAKKGTEPFIYRLARPTLSMVCTFCTGWVLLTVIPWS
ncbi:MAG: DUF3307 domain-containing protein [Chloroflexi bacterium]|nr:DUF3307 domain-containing protein [Chloroflexota bacterium]